MSDATMLVMVKSLLDAIEAGDEEAITLKSARKLPLLRRDGKAPDISQMYRWVTHGVRGHKLETAAIGGSLVTTAAAVRRFVNAINGGGVHTLPDPIKARRNQITAADARCAARGL
jgi:hypothetical protein